MLMSTCATDTFETKAGKHGAHRASLKFGSYKLSRKMGQEIRQFIRGRNKTVEPNTRLQCPILQKEPSRDCCQGECTFRANHNCLWVKYFSETSEIKREKIWLEAHQQNIVLREQIRQLKLELGLVE